MTPDMDDPFADLSGSQSAEPILPVQGIAAEVDKQYTPAFNAVHSAAAPHAHKAVALDISAMAKLIFFRQSMLKDYMTCPQMMAYRWMMGMQQEAGMFFSAFLGTAGHEVLYLMHHTRKFDYTWLELLELFEIAFRKAVDASSVPPTLGKHYRTIQEEFNAKANDYVAMLDGYMRDTRNHQIYPVMQEQPFVLEVESDISGQSVRYIYTGVIDLGIFHQDGRFGIRDYKFKENSFKPNKIELDLDIQFTLYALAAAKGNPACEACRPRYEGGELSAIPEGLPGHVPRQLVYNGPCSDCRDKINKKRWPRRFASPCELVWMRDYFRHEKDQKEKYVPDRSKPKVKGGKNGTSWVYQQMINPEWGEGHKKGDYVGRCLYPTYRDPALLDTLLTDILRMSDAIKRGEIFRRPGEACSFWCKFKDPCMSEIKVAVNEKHMLEDAAFASEGFA